MQCPICNRALIKVETEGVQIDSCSHCKGAWFERGELHTFLETSTKEFTPAQLVQHQQSSDLKDDGRYAGGYCPNCSIGLDKYKIGDSQVDTVTCFQCGGLWIDMEQLIHLEHWYCSTNSSSKNDVTPPRARKNDFIDGGESYVKSLVGLIEDDNPVQRRPIATLCLIATNFVLAALSTFFPEVRKALWMVPSAIADNPADSVTLVTSTFAHAGIVHLLGNMYFLWVFGDNIEDRLGRLKFLCLYFTAGIVASLSHMVFVSNPDIPVLGASGAVSGIMGAYLALYPKGQLKFHQMVYFRAYTINVPVWVYLGIWFLGNQFLWMWLGMPGIAWHAHIGGFLLGLAAALSMKKLDML